MTTTSTPSRSSAPSLSASPQTHRRRAPSPCTSAPLHRARFRPGRRHGATSPRRPSAPTATVPRRPRTGASRRVELLCTTSPSRRNAETEPRRQAPPAPSLMPRRLLELDHAIGVPRPRPDAPATPSPSRSFAKHRRAELRPRPRHGHQEPATSAPSPPRHGSHAELHAASTAPASPPSPRPWTCCIQAEVVPPLGPRRRHPGCATLDAVTTVTLLSRPRAVHHQNASMPTQMTGNNQWYAKLLT